MNLTVDKLSEVGGAYACVDCMRPILAGSTFVSAPTPSRAGLTIHRPICIVCALRAAGAEVTDVRVWPESINEGAK